MSYLIPAFFLIGIGAISFLVHFILAILLILIGALLILAKTGVSFSSDHKNAMDHRSILGYKFGKTFDLQKYDRVELTTTKEAIRMQSRGSSNIIRANTYDIKLYSESTSEILMHEFTEYSLALKAYSFLVEQVGYNGSNEVADKRQAIARNRPKDRRR